MSRIERMFADLERGFTALEEGRVDDAAAVVERCRRIDRKNPDVIALGAAVADARGDSEDALASYQELAELRPDDPMPRICIARIQLTDMGEPEAALASVESAFDFVDEEADLIEAIYVKAQALVALDQHAKAREALEELTSSAIDDGDLALDFAELALAAQDAPAAKRWIELAHKNDPELEADALHLLGRVHELAGDRTAMITAWQKVRTLDMKAPDGKITVSEDEVESIALATLAELPKGIRDKLEQVPILIDDFPSADVVGDGFDPRSLGLFQGTPMPEGGHGTPTVTNILLYRKNLERFALDKNHLAAEIRITVLHETAHYFGLDEDDLEALGLD
jgi:predicted Zn-dependent protease with MMP-like domain/Tfp pilus assembly protein PilF